MTDDAAWLPATLEPSSPLASLLVEQATVDEGGALFLTGLVHPTPHTISVALDGAHLGDAFLDPLPEGGVRFGLHTRLPAPLRLAEAAQLTISVDGRFSRVPLGGRLSAAAPVWFADATWTAAPDPFTALDPGDRPNVLIVSHVLPTAPAAAWLPVADLAAALRLVGCRIVFLYNGPSAAIARCVASLLQSFDVVHHAELLGAVQSWDPIMPGAWPQPSAALRGMLARLVEGDDPALVVASSLDLLGAVEKLPGARRGAVLLDREAVLAPRMLFAPVAREKAAISLRMAMARVLTILPSEGLLHELTKWRGTAAAAVLPTGRALAALHPPPAGVAGVVALGPIATEAARQGAGPRVIGLPADASLDAVRAALTGAGMLVLEPGVAPALGLFARAMGRLLATVAPGDEAEPAALQVKLAAEVAAMRDLLPVTPPGFDALAFAADIGLGPRRDLRPSALLQAAVAARLASSPVPARTGLLVEARSTSAEVIAPIFASLAGPGRVFARSADGAPAGTLPLHQAAAEVEVMLYDGGGDAAAARMIEERLLTEGLLPMPLDPRAAWADRAALRALRTTAAGGTAYLGPDPAPAGATLRCALSNAVPAGGAEVVALVDAGHAARGRMLTLFEATSTSAMRRPGNGAVGYDVTPGAAGLDLLSGLAGAHPAEPLLAAALLLGCKRVLLAPALAADPDLAPALATLAAAGVMAMAVDGEALLMVGAA